MTADIEAVAVKSARANTSIVAINPEYGPASIQGREDGEACLPGLFELFEKMVTEPSDFDAVIIACFDDTGLDALRSRSKVPVIGIGQAAFHAATILGRSFSTITTLPISVPIIEDNIIEYGFSKYSKGVRASQVAVLDVGADTAIKIKAEAHKAIDEDHAEIIVLGCAGMADLAEQLSLELNHPVIDGVAAAVRLSEALVGSQAP